MKRELNYNIHDILKFKIIKNKKLGLIKDLNPEYSFFEVEEVDNPDITINIGRFTPSNDDCYVVDDKYYIKENYFYCKDADRRVKWEVEIFGFEEGNTSINLKANFSGIRFPFSDFLIQNLLLRSLIQYKMGERECFLLHAGSVSKDNHGIILAGRGGSFKTTLIMDFIRKSGFDFLGDENVIIHKKDVWSYPFNITSFNFRCEYLPTENISKFLDKIRLIRYNWKKYGRTDNFKANIIPSAKIKALFLITKKNQQRVAINKNLDLKDAIEKLITNDKIEISILPTHTLTGITSNHYLNYMLAYSFVFPNSKIATYWDDMKENLKGLLRSIPIYEVEVPFTYNSEIFNEIYEHIKKIE